MKKYKIIIFFILIVVISCITTISLADTSNTKPSFKTFFKDGLKFVERAEKSEAIIDVNALVDSLGGTFGLIFTIAVVGLIIATLVLGIKYLLMSNPKQKAEMNKKVFGVVLATVIVSGAYTIWITVYNILSSIE